MLNMNEESQSSSSSTPLSSSSENLNPTANWSLNDSLTEPMTITFDDYKFPSSTSEGSDDGIYEDHLGRNPSSEGIVELQSDIHETLESMINSSPQDFLGAESHLNDFNINEGQGEAYTERQELSFSSGNMEPVGVEYSSVAVTSSRSPVESEEIVALVDSSPSPMIRPRPPQPPLTMENRDDEFHLDLEDIMLMEATWLSIQGVCNDETNVLVPAATNTPYALGQAMRRRFDKRIYVPLPDLKAREHIFKVHIGDTPHNLTETDFEHLARRTQGFSGSDISYFVKDALYQPVRATLNAQFFRKTSKGMWVPCKRTQQGATEITLQELNAQGLALKIQLPPNTRADFDKMLARQKPTVSEADLEVHKRFNKEFGNEG